MAKVFIEETTLTAIGDAIRGKTGKTELIDPANMSTEIAGIEAGSGPDIPESAFVLQGDCSYRFAYGNWDWFVQQYGDRITCGAITGARYLFQGSKLEEIPFQITVNSNTINLTRMLDSCNNLKVCPKIRGTISWNNSSTTLEDLCNAAHLLRDTEDLLTPEMTEGFSSYKVTSAYSMPQIPRPGNYMYSLRRVPSWWYNFKLNPESTAYPSASYTIYPRAFDSANTLDEVRDIPVWRCNTGAAQTSNMFSNTFSSCYRLKAITFETNNGQPIETKWKAQTIDLTSRVGYGGTDFNYTGYNSGITGDKKVPNDAQIYQALKNDPDWYTTILEYSRYNHDSAVETINSLPDTSAYLASAGGTNTIKFKKASGVKTDGGAIENLTAEEIAVAAAKGWTVTLVS